MDSDLIVAQENLNGFMRVRVPSNTLFNMVIVAQLGERLTVNQGGSRIETDLSPKNWRIN